MRKLGIIFAITAAATLGIAGTASAQQEVCDVPQMIADGAPENDPADGTGEPVTSSAQGAADSCNDSFEATKLKPSPLLCGVAKGLDARPGADLGQEIGTATAGALNDGLADGVGDTPIVAFEACGPTTTTTAPPGGNGNGNGNGGGGNGGGGTDPDVLANNAAADGGLPRTGTPELLAGLGFGLTGIGTLVRRFIG